MHNGDAPHSGEAENNALEGVEDIWVRDERSRDDERVGRVSRSGIHLNVDILQVCGGDFCADSGGLEDGLDPESVLEDGSGCRNCSEEVVS